jgi:signal transduction histidine kinase
MSFATIGPMMNQTFQHRSGRVIALGRVVLSVFFTLAIWLDPARSAEADDRTFLLIIAYTLFADVVLLATWNRWWLESWVAIAAHAVDLAVFTVLVLLTEGYISPFFTFFVFLILSASIRWGWRTALVTNALVIALFVTAIFVATSGVDPIALEIPRLLARAGNLLVLSLMIVWFAVNHPGLGEAPWDSRVLEGLPAMAAPQRLAAMRYLSRELAAARLLFAWCDLEEPWLHVWDLRGDILDTARFGPDEFPEIVSAELSDQPFLFDLQRRRVLVRRLGTRRVLAAGDALKEPFATRFHLDSGLAVPIRTVGFRGQLFALGVPGLCADHLTVAARIGHEVESAFEQTTLSLATKEAATTRVRLRLARDLHDSVVQFLAGMALKLRAIGTDLEPDSALRKEIEDLQLQLAQEQRDLRALIAAQIQPRSETQPEEPVGQLADRLERQWGLSIDLSFDPASLQIPAALRHDLEQLIREAVANAARHGEAKHIAIQFAESGQAFILSIADNGKGFPVDGQFTDPELRKLDFGPRSFHERVQSLGGTVTLASSRNRGATLVVSLPRLAAAA